MEKVIGSKIAASTLSACSTLGGGGGAGIDYKASYELAGESLHEYYKYQYCMDKLDRRPLPEVRLLSNKSDEEDVIEAYSEYVNELIEYIHDLKTQCVAPLAKQLPVMKGS